MSLLGPLSRRGFFGATCGAVLLATQRGWSAPKRESLLALIKRNLAEAARVMRDRLDRGLYNHGQSEVWGYSVSHKRLIEAFTRTSGK